MVKAKLLGGILLSATLAAAATTTQAQQIALTRDPAKVEAGSYTLEPVHTRVLFGVSHFGFSTYYGVFTQPSGTLKLAPQDPSASKLEVQIPVNAIDTTNAKLDSDLKAPDWFDAQKYPNITFTSTNVTVTGQDEAKVSGELTIRGVTKPVTLTVRFNGAGINPVDKHYTVGFDATTTIKRSEFGMTKYVPLIGDNVALTISAAFERQG